METGTIINQYKIISAIGKGGMGEVFLAQDTKLKRQVALKILPSEFAADKDRMSRFVREAQSASALNHPNIITIHEIGESDGTHFIATEFIDGKTLNDYKTVNPLNYKSALEIAIQVASALDEAHQAGIVHRDIKPDNVMIRANGLAKILDFGIAKLSGRGDAETRRQGEEDNTLVAASPIPRVPASPSTSPGMIIGTANYMSPEQAKGKAIDTRTDIFSFGVVLYEMIAGGLPFEGENALEMIGAILKDQPKPLSSEVPTEITKIISKCLRKNRDERYQTIKDVMIDLKDVKQDLEFQDKSERSIVPTQDANKTQILQSTTLDEINQTTTNQTVPGKSKTKYFAAGLLTLLLAVGGFLGYKYFGSQPIKVSLESAKFTRLTNSGKVGNFIAISPDGKWLVYTVVEGEQQSLWLKQVAIPDSNTQIAPPSETIYGGMSFSPDGNYLYYTDSGKGNVNGSLFQVPVLGGTARKVVDGIWGKVSFSPDGKQISYISYVDDEDRLMIANADGTEKRLLAVRKGNESFVSGLQGPAWSPDGKTIATTIGTIVPQSMSVATVAISTGEIIQFSSQKFSFTGDVTWLADGKSVLIHARETETQVKSLWQISYPSGEAKQITNDMITRFSISLTADSNALATVQGDQIAHVWIASIADGGRAKQVTSGSDLNVQPTWTTSGKMVFTRASAGASDLFMVDPNSGSPRQLTADAGKNDFPEVSPDERYIVFRSDRSGTNSVWRIGIDGSNPKQLVAGADKPGSFSPDGGEIIFLRNLNKQTVWKVSIEGGEPVQLTDKQSTSPRFSPDGKQFVCLLFDDAEGGPKIAIFPSTGGSPIKTFPAPKTIGTSLRWTPDGQSIAYADSKGGVGNIWTQPVGGGTPKQLTNFTSELIYEFDISRDGKQLVLNRGTRTTDVVLISNIKK